ncbi:MAG: hypothetical protein IV092_09220 [Burkholderiaceae bacterium]|nr:hypothetical protein [Burkholderiaceae bacterium]
MTGLPSLDANGVQGSIAYGINAAGTVVGSESNQAAQWKNCVKTSLTEEQRPELYRPGHPGRLGQRGAGHQWC